MKVGSKWKCKIGTCIVTCFAKWLLTKHLKEVHGLTAKKAKPRKLSISKRGPQHQDHVKMNVRILGNAMVMQRWNDQKVVSRIHAKAQCERDRLVIIAEQCSSLPKPTLVKISFNTIFAIVGSQCLGCGKHASKCNIWMGKNEDLQKMIHSFCICMTIENGMGCQKLRSKIN